MMNTTNRVSAIFHDRAQAQQAVAALMGMGVNESNMSIVAQQSHGGATGTGAADAADAAGDVTKGTMAGMGVGALFGIAAALIPGVGPFITAGTLLTTALGAVGGGAVAGAVVGGTTGAIASTLARAGYNEHEASYYGSQVESGGTLVVVDTTGLNDQGVRNVLSQYGGQSAGTVAQNRVANEKARFQLRKRAFSCLFLAYTSVTAGDKDVNDGSVGWCISLGVTSSQARKIVKWGLCSSTFPNSCCALRW